MPRPRGNIRAACGAQSEAAYGEESGGARLDRKGQGQPARLAELGHVLVENRQGLSVDAMATFAEGTAEAEAALLMAYRWQQAHRRRVTLVADRAYDRRDLLETLRQVWVVVHGAQKRQGSAPDRGTTRHAGNQRSQRRRTVVERAFAWLEWVAGAENGELAGAGQSQLAGPVCPHGLSSVAPAQARGAGGLSPCWRPAEAAPKVP